MMGKKITSNKIEIHQFVPMARYGDAVFDATLALRNSLRNQGYISNIYYQGFFPPADKEGIKHNKFPQDSSNKRIIIYHFAIGSLLSQFIRNISAPKILIYHNMTPVRYLYGVDNNSALAVMEGRKELRDLSDDITLALGVSEYNRQELEEDYGFKNTGVLPIIIDFEKFRQYKLDEKVVNRFRDGKKNLLFVGKIAPHKCQEDIIKVFYYYNKYINRYSRLFLVGSTYGMEEYQGYLKQLTSSLGLKEAVVFTGHVNHNEFIAYYSIADLFLCLSEHEGFCVPLLESMYFDLPIIAYKAAAVPETLGGAGVLINQKKYKKIAEWCDLIISHPDLYQKIITGQRERLRNFRSESIELILKGYINQVLSNGEL